jgi:hypothetical protein
MFRISSAYVIAFILAVAACGKSSPEPAKPSPSQPAESPPATRTTADVLTLCERHYARKATCADDYLPALLDLRVELDVPPGIGDQIKAKGRDALLAQAHKELAREAEPANAATFCETNLAKAPPELVDRVFEHGRRCEATADCKSFATCAIAMDRGFLSGANRRAAASQP